jgi:DNA sulfur modification protein DndD
MENQMSENVDFAQRRAELKHYRDEESRALERKGEVKGIIVSLKDKIGSIELQMRNQEARNAENEKWRQRLALAEAVYENLSADFSEREKKIFCELNQEIQANFSKMFNAKDKRIQLSEDYEIQMCYKTDVAYKEEKNLSEGEKVARNFAFIVTIMASGA